MLTFYADIGKGKKTSDKTPQEIAQALQQKYPSRSHRGGGGESSPDKPSGSWPTSQAQAVLQVNPPEVYSQTLHTSSGNFYGQSEFFQIENISSDPIVSILTPGGESAGMQVVQGQSRAPSEQFQTATAAVLIPVHSQGGPIQQPQASQYAHQVAYSTQVIQQPPQQQQQQQAQHEGYMVPVIASPSQQQRQQQQQSSSAIPLHIQSQYRPPLTQ